MERSFEVDQKSGTPEITCEKLNAVIAKGGPDLPFRIIDVRRPDEFTGELGHIPGAELVTLGDELVDFLEDNDPNEEIVFVCRSGGRSGQATNFSLELGFTRTSNMVGGMLAWNEKGYRTEK